jgi:hypothetical protein
MDAPWSFGVEPLPEQLRYARAVRSVTSLMLTLDQAEPEFVALVDALEAAEQALTRLVPTDLRPRLGSHADGPGRVYLDHCLDIGVFNPMFPTYTFTTTTPDGATGTVTFPICYEAAPGLVNGGVLGVFIDTIVGHHNSICRQGGPTRNLDMRYLRPVPLLADLDFEIVRTTDERSVHSEVRLLRNGDALVTATTSAVRFDHASTAEVSPRRVTSHR